MGWTTSLAWVGAPLLAGVVWYVAQFYGAPILALRQKRHEALRLAERYAYYRAPPDDETIAHTLAARRALFDISSELRALVRQHRIVRIFNRLARYDLELATEALRGLAQMLGHDMYETTIKTNNLNAVYYALGADSHLTKEQRDELKREIAKAKAKSSFQVQADQTGTTSA